MSRLSWRRAPMLERVAAMLLAALVLAGCSGDERPTEESETPDFATQVQAALTAARSDGAGQGQLAILEAAQAAGVVTYEQAREAIVADMECYNDGGGTAEYSEQVEESGLRVPGAIALAPDDDTLTSLAPLMEGCTTRESFWVTRLYQLQPTSQMIRDAYTAGRAPAVRECLEEHGYSTDPDTTAQELLWQALEVVQATHNAIDCYS